MATTLTIPLTTLPVGTRTFGPASIADSDTQVKLSIDRTPAGGLNSLTPATTLAIEIFESTDGVNFQSLCAASTPGGVYTDAHGNTINVTWVTCSLIPGTGRLMRGTVTVTGTSVAVAGTLSSS